MKFSKVLAGSIASWLLAAAAQSASIVWTGGDGLWNVATNWSGGVIPAGGDDVILGTTGASLIYLNSTNPALNTLLVDAAGGTTFVHPANSITAATVIVGDTRQGSYVQTGGTLTVTGNTPESHLIIGAGNGGSGSYTITNGSIQANAIHVGGGSTPPGWVSSGLFEQSGGSVNLTTGAGELVIGDSPGTSGLYLMKGGTLATKHIYVGVKGSNGSGRTFNQTAGTVTVNGMLALGGFTGGSTATTGTYILSGEATSQLFSAVQFVGVSGTGVFTQNGGTNNVTLGSSAAGERSLLVGALEAGSTGTYNMNSGVLNTEAIYIGNPGKGTFNHVGGTVNVTRQMIVDNGGGASSLGRYVMTGGQLNTTGSGTTPGLLITGVFQHQGGTITANGLGSDAGFRNDGTYTFAGGTLTGNGIKLNTGVFTGFGTISGTGKLINQGVMTFNGGASTFNAPVENAAGRTMEVFGAIAVFNNSFKNYGTFRSIHSEVFFNGDFHNSGIMVSDPSITTINGSWFHDEDSSLVVDLPGGDVFRVRGNVELATSNRAEWDTRLGILQFFKDEMSNGQHSLIYAGLDLGPTYAPLLKKLPNGEDPAGYEPNFGWGEVIIDEGNILHAIGGALYTNKLTFSGTHSDITAQVAMFTGDLKIFYDPVQNPALEGATFAFAEGSEGFIAPVPEPSSIALLGFGALTAGFARLRRQRRG